MSKKKEAGLSRRETQIMDIVYAAAECNAGDVQQAMPNAPGYSTVRKLLGILIEKGHLTRRLHKGRYLYKPVRPRQSAGKSALARVLSTFYEGSLEKAVAAMLATRESKLSEDELNRLSQLIEDARQEG